MLTIAEPYARFSASLESPDLERLAKAVLASAEEIVHAHYAERYKAVDIRVSVRIEIGSTKVWITVAVVTLGAVLEYGSLRQSVDYLIKDGRSVAEIVLPHLPQVLHLPPESLVYRQRRLGVPGQLERLFQDVEEGRLSAEEATKQALEILRETEDAELEPELADALATAFRKVRARQERVRKERQQRQQRQQFEPPAIDLPRRRRRGMFASRDKETGAIRLQAY